MRRPLHLVAAVFLALCVHGTLQAAPVSIATPPNGATINGNQVEIVVNFTSTSALPVTRVDVSLDATRITQRVYATPVASGACRFRWDTTRTPNGKHAVDVLAAHAGTVVGSARIEVTVSNKPEDRSAPSISVSSPKEGQVVSGTTPIVVQASDDSGVDPFVSIFIDETLRSVSNQTINKYDWDTTEYQNGPHLIDVKATDDTENRSSARVRVIVKNAVKQTSIAAPSVEIAAAAKVSAATIATAASKQTATASTPTENTATKEQEVARSASEPGTEKFEVAQSPETGAAAMIGSAKPGAVGAGAAPTNPASSTAQTASDARSSPTAPRPEAAAATPAPETMATEPSAVPADAMAKSAATEPDKSDMVAKLPETIPDQPGPPSSATETPKPVQVASKPAPMPYGVASDIGERPVLMAKAIGTYLVSPAPKSDTRLQMPALPPERAVNRGAQATKPEAATANTVSKPVETPTLVIKMAAPKSATVLMAKAQTAAQTAAIAPKPAGTLVAFRPSEALTAVARTVRAIGRAIRIRFAFQSAGGRVEWNHTEKTVHAVTRTNDVRVKIGSPIAVVNGKRINMGKAAYIRSGRTMVPIDFITKVLRMAAK